MSSWSSAGCNTGAPRVFLLSTTHGAETTGLAAFLAVSEAYEERDVVAEMEARGDVLRAGFDSLVRRHGLEGTVSVSGRSSCLVFSTRDAEGQPSQAFRALFIQEMLTRGVLGQSFVISAAHTEEDVERTLEASDGALAVYAQAVSAGHDRRPARRAPGGAGPAPLRRTTPALTVPDAGPRRPKGGSLISTSIDGMPSLSALRSRVAALPGTSRLRDALDTPSAEVLAAAPPGARPPRRPALTPTAAGAPSSP